MRTALKTTVAGFTLVVIGMVAASQLDLFDLVNPFGSETVVRDHAAVLESLEDLSEYHAATGEYQVVVDVEDRTRYVPGFLKGERTTFLAEGSESVIVSEDGRTVTVVLPSATLAEPSLDHDASTVLDRDRGLLDRVGSALSDSPSSDRRLYLEAESRLAEAAAGSELQATAERNTTQMLEDLLSSAGFERVRVVFADPADAT